LLFDPGEGTQRQFIFANIAPTVISRIFISHFHGDHCLGLGSILMRLNLDKITHPVHCYFPASGQKYFHRLRYGTIYHDTVRVIEHPVSEEGLVHDDGKFRIEAVFLDHGVDNLGWRVTEPDTRKYDPEALKNAGLHGLQIKQLIQDGYLVVEGRRVELEQVSHVRKGDSIAIVIDTRYCQSAVEIAKNAKMLLCESTYLEEHRDLAYRHQHLTAKEAATIAKEAHVHTLVLTHYSARYQSLKNFEKEAKEIFPNVFIGEDLKTFPLIK
jgi:ribonuclease Z